MTTCPHKRMRSVVVFLDPTEPHQLRRAVITLQCHLCGTPFEFAGVVEGPGITLSADRKELRVAISEAVEGLVQ
jgi:hypothetical protein